MSALTRKAGPPCSVGVLPEDLLSPSRQWTNRTPRAEQVGKVDVEICHRGESTEAPSSKPVRLPHAAPAWAVTLSPEREVDVLSPGQKTQGPVGTHTGRAFPGG